MVWMDGWKLCSAWVANAVALQESLFAAQGVIAHRKPILEQAFRRPFEADFTEIFRMGSEKADAFGKSGASMVESWRDLSGQMMAQAGDISSLMTCWPPSIETIERINRRGSALMLGLGTASGRAFAPVHAAVTDNERRLSRSRRRKKA